MTDDVAALHHGDPRLLTNKQRLERIEELLEAETRYCARIEALQRDLAAAPEQPSPAYPQFHWPQPYVVQIGCICPPSANTTCERVDCPRKGVKS